MHFLDLLLDTIIEKLFHRYKKDITFPQFDSYSTNNGSAIHSDSVLCLNLADSLLLDTSVELIPYINRH